MPRIGDRMLLNHQHFAVRRSWLALRGLSLVWATYLSSIWPGTELERALEVWPPTRPFVSWLSRVVTMPWMRWDVACYISIASEGYRLDNGSAQFHPLYPLLASVLAKVGVDALLALFIVETVAVFLMLPAFERLARLDVGSDDAQFAALLLITRPVAAILLAPYSEALFLLWAVLCLSEARRGHWWCAGLAGGLAALTRQQGILLFLPLAWEFVECHGGCFKRAARNWRSALGLGLIPAGFGAWLAYRALALNDLRPDFSSLSAFIYTVPISQSANLVVPEQSFVWPWVALKRALMQVWLRPDVDLITNLVLGFAFVLGMALSWRYLRRSYRLYVVAVVLVSFSYYTGEAHPYMGLPRHLFLAFPVLIGLAARIRKPRSRLLVIISGLLGLAFMILLYVAHVWVP